MNSRRRPIALLALSALTIGAAACGDDDSSSNDDGPAAASSEATTVETTGAPSTSAGDDAAATAPSGPSSSPPADSAPSASAPDGGETRMFEAENGTVEIPAEPQRIVACGYAVLPLLQAEANLAGICEWSRELDDMSPDVRAAYDELPKVGPDGDASAINYEAITAADPDLIIMGVPVHFLADVNVDALESLAPVIALGPEVPGDWRTLNPRYADAAGVSETYGRFVEEYEELAADMAERYSALSDLTFGGVCTHCPEESATFRRAYASGHPTNLFDDLGFDFPGEPADPELPPHGESMSIEQLGESFADVDVVVYGVDADGTVPESGRHVLESPLWETLPAVQAGNVVPFEHYAAATHPTAILALRSIDEQLSTLPAFTDAG